MIIIALLFSNCNKKEDEKPEVPKLNVIDISEETDWDFIVLGKKDYFYVQSNEYGPDLVLLHSAETNLNYYMTFSNEGYVEKLMVQDFIFLFDNFNGNNVDIGIIYPNGDIEVQREVKSDINWDELTLKSANSVEGWKSTYLRTVARSISAIPCVMSVALSVGTAGAATPIALWTCGNFLLGLTADVMSNDFDIHNGFTDFVDIYGASSTGLGCSSGEPVGCAIDAASMALHDIADHLEEVEERSDDINVTLSALAYGYGAIQITLNWDNNADLDLYVIDPYGEQIYWKHDFSSSNGTLDVDNTDGLGPENIYWRNLAPDGDYEIYVHHYDWEEAGRPQSSNYTVLVNAFGNFKKYHGSIDLDETIHITDFNKNGIKSAKIKTTNRITIENKQ